MLIIPSIDLQNGKSVKLIRGKPGTGLVVSNDPVKVAEHWEREGAELLHVVDLDGAMTGVRKNTDSIKQILKNVNVPVEVGGGIRTAVDVREVLGMGAEWVILGTSVVEQPDFLPSLVESVSPSRIIIAVDSKGGRTVTHGWAKTSSQSPVSLVKRYQSFRVKGFLYTDVNVEGMMRGIGLTALSELVRSTALPVVYSGGISSIGDVRSIALSGAAGAVIGMALYKGAFTLKEAKEAAGNAKGED